MAGFAGRLFKACLVFMGIYLQCVIQYSSAVGASAFYVTHLTSRGISKFQVGLIGMIPAVGYLCNTFHDTVHFFLSSKGISLRKLQAILLAVIVVNCTGQGIAELIIPPQYNLILVIVLLLQRIVHGYVEFLGSKTSVECCMAWFPDHVSLTVGLEASGGYVGGAPAILMGGYVYESYGFTAPFLVLGVANVIFWCYNMAVMPKTSSPVYESKVYGAKSIDRSKNDSDDICEDEVRDQRLRSASTSSLGLTWLVVFPLIAQMATVGLEGFSAAITTPYLNETFGVSIGQGGSYVFTQYIGLTLGSTISGIVLQFNWASPIKVMSVGSLVACLGVLLMFPGPRLHFLYQIVPQVAYFATFLQGVGSNLVTVATLMAIPEVHIFLANRPYTTNNKSMATTLWLCCWMVASYGGNMVALMVMEFMSYGQGGLMMAGCSFLSMVISIVLEILVRKSHRTTAVVVEPTDGGKPASPQVFKCRIMKNEGACSNPTIDEVE